MIDLFKTVNAEGSEIEMDANQRSQAFRTRYYKYFVRDTPWDRYEYDLRSILVTVMIDSKNLFVGYDALQIDDIDYLTKNHHLLLEILKCQTSDEIEILCATKGIGEIDWRLLVGLAVLEIFTINFRESEKDVPTLKHISNLIESSTLFDKAIQNDRIYKVIETIQIILSQQNKLRVIQICLDNVLSAIKSKQKSLQKSNI